MKNANLDVVTQAYLTQVGVGSCAVTIHEANGLQVDFSCEVRTKYGRMYAWVDRYSLEWIETLPATEAKDWAVLLAIKCRDCCREALEVK